MTLRPFRFGIQLFSTGSRALWQDLARQAEDLGYDVIQVADHLGRPAPFPALVSAADVTTRPRLGTMVLNASFYTPALLARDVAGTDQLIDGRLELGLGTGYAQPEFKAAGLRFPSPAERVDHLARMVAELRHLMSDETYQPRPQQRSGPPILLAGHGNRVLTLAAKHADIVGFLGISTTASPKGGDVGHDVFAERIAFLRGAAGDRLPRLELNLQIQAVTLDDAEPNHSFTRLIAPDLPEDAVVRQPGVLRGSVQNIAETLHRYREIYGVTYFSIPQLDMLSFGKVLRNLR